MSDSIDILLSCTTYYVYQAVMAMEALNEVIEAVETGQGNVVSIKAKAL
jgi:hypothetical protein